MVKSVEQWVSKYKDRAGVAEGDYLRGVQNPKRPPASAAIASRKAFEAKMRSPETFDKWEAGLRHVGDEGVIRAAVEKGAPRYVDGINKGLNKYKEFAASFSTHIAEGQRKVLAMPKVTLADSEKRMVEMMRHNAKFRFKK